jgi:iron complex outermembrane recepter protein
MKRVLLICMLTCMFTTASAEEKIAIEEVVVTATRYEEKITDIPANITVITERDIKNSTAQNIPELLKTEAGVHVSDVTGNRRSFFVDLRGFGETSSSNTLVLVDGRRINQPDLSGVDWTQIPLERVARIEIIKGGRGGVLYGDNATGGVVNIITKSGGPLKAGADLSAGSYSTFKAGSYATGELKNLSLHLSGNYAASDGYRDNSKTDSRDIGLNAGYYFGDFLKMNLSSGYHKDTAGLPGALKESDFAAGASRRDSRFPDDFARVEDYYIKIGPEVYLAGDSTIRLDASFRKRTFLSFSSGDWGNFLGDSEIKTFGLSPQILLKQNFGNFRNTLTAGLDYQTSDNDILNNSLFFGSSSLGIFELKKNNHGYYFHDEISMNDRLHVSGGYRYDRAKFRFDPSTPDSATFSEDAYTAGITYSLQEKSNIYFSYSKSFRYPLLDELYSFFINSVNTELTSQTSDNYEVGVRHNFNNRISARVNVFRVDTSSEIFFNPDTFTNENLDGDTKREGIEFAFDSRAAEWLTLRGNYTFSKAQIKKGIFKGRDIPNVPEHKIAVDVISLLGPGFTAALRGIYVGERPFVSDFSNEFDNQKGYFLLNAKLAYEWKSLKAFIDVNNLLDKEYSEYGVKGGFPVEKAFYPSPGRNVLAGLSFSF